LKTFFKQISFSLHTTKLYRKRFISISERQKSHSSQRQVIVNRRKEAVERKEIINIPRSLYIGFSVNTSLEI